MPRHHTIWDASQQKQINVSFTAKEEAARDAEEAQAVIDIQTEKDFKAQKATDKASGNQKLLDLGLSQAEVDALTT